MLQPWRPRGARRKRKVASRLYQNTPRLKRRRWRKRERARSARVGSTTVPVGQQLSISQKILCSFRSARVGAEAVSSDDLGKYLDDLHVQHLMLNVSVEKQHESDELGKGGAQFVKEWREYLNYKLPTSILVPGVAPQYADGPLGWRQWYEDNTSSPVAMTVWTDRLRREGKEYQSALREFHKRFEKLGGATKRPAPSQPTVEEMPGPIAPVPTQKDVEEAAETAAEIIVTPAIAVSKAYTKAIAAQFGVSPAAVRIGGAVAALAALAIAVRVAVPR